MLTISKTCLCLCICIAMLDHSVSCLVAPWDQCGGFGYKGETRCTSGWTCYQRSEWYAQCRQNCPADWDCAKSIGRRSQPLAASPLAKIAASKPSNANGNKLVSQREFEAAVTKNGATSFVKPTDDQYNSFVSQLQTAGGITSKREAAMFLSQIIWESGGLKFKRELACVQTGCLGKYSTSLGVPGQNYYGRGYIQLTWDYNYKAASYDLFGDDRLLRNADSVASDEKNAWATAMWFWKKNVAVRPAVKAGKFGASTLAINGMECKGYNGHAAHKRFQIYKNVMREFGSNEIPDETGCYN